MYRNKLSKNKHRLDDCLLSIADDKSETQKKLVFLETIMSSCLLHNVIVLLQTQSSHYRELFNYYFYETKDTCII